MNRAADGAAELAIIQKQETQTRSYKVGENNIGAAKDKALGDWYKAYYSRSECGGWRNERDYGLSSEDP